MKNKSCLTFLLLFFLVLGCTRDKLSVPKPSVHTLGNGMTVFILEDSSLPTFRLFGYIPAGSVLEGPGEIGLASLTAQLIRTGGTQSLSPQQVDEAISNASAAIELGAGDDEATVALKVLASDRRPMLALLADLLMHPRFDPMAFEIARRQALVALTQAKEKPAGLAALYFPGTLYGRTSPWAVIPTIENLNALTAEGAQQFYARSYRPDRMILAVSGDFKTSEMVAELEETIGQWKLPAGASFRWPEVEQQPPRAVFVPKPAEQVAVRMGHLGAKRDNPDKFALIIANFILGGSGSMTSRLGAEIRANQGQAYSVWSRFGFDRVPGIFEMVAQTESSQLESVVNSMRRILANMREEGVREDEVQDAKTAILRSLLFDYESRYAIAKDWARFESWGYPRNYLATFAKEIGKVDVDDVNRVLVEYFHPDQLSYMVVGPRWLSTQVQKNWPALEIVSESQLDGATEKTEE